MIQKLLNLFDLKRTAIDFELLKRIDIEMLEKELLDGEI